MKSKGKEDVLSKRMTTEYNFVVVRDEMVSYEYCMQHVAQNVEEIDDGEILMLCSDQQKGRMPEKILTETSESHVFETVLNFDDIKYDEENLLNKERSKVLQQKEHIDEMLERGT